MVNPKRWSMVLIATPMLLAPTMAHESYVARHASVKADTSIAALPINQDGEVCVLAPRVGAFATAPWTGDNVPCEPNIGVF